MVEQTSYPHPVKIGEHGRLVNIGEEREVADGLRTDRSLVKAWPCLIATVDYITPVLPAIHPEGIAFRHGARAIHALAGVVQSAVITVYRTVDALAPQRQRQGAQAYVHGEKEAGTYQHEREWVDSVAFFHCHGVSFRERPGAVVALRQLRPNEYGMVKTRRVGRVRAALARRQPAPAWP